MLAIFQRPIFFFVFFFLEPTSSIQGCQVIFTVGGRCNVAYLPTVYKSLIVLISKELVRDLLVDKLGFQVKRGAGTKKFIYSSLEQDPFNFIGSDIAYSFYCCYGTYFEIVLQEINIFGGRFVLSVGRAWP